MVLIFLATLSLAPTLTDAAHLQGYHTDLEARYAHAHSLGDGYLFDPRDGWETVNVTDLQYKYEYRREDHEPDDLDDDDDDDGEDDFAEGDDDGEVVLADQERPDGIEKRAVKIKPKSKARAKPKSKSKSKSKAKSKAKSKSKSKAKAKSKSHASKAKAASSKAKTKTSGGAGVSLTTIVESIKGVGQSEPVTITWYVRVEYRERPGCSMCFQVYWTRPLEP